MVSNYCLRQEQTVWEEPGSRLFFYEKPALSGGKDHELRFIFMGNMI